MDVAYIFYVTLWLVALFKSSIGLAVCGDGFKEHESKEASDEIVKRLMAYRKPDWGWEFPSTATILQVAAPRKFFGRQRTAKSIEAAVVANAKKMTIRSLSQNAIALNALCRDDRNVSGIDLVKQLDERLKSQFPGKESIPKDGYWMYSIGMAALCITGYPIDPYLVNKLLEGQNSNGSFGSTDHIGHTAAMMPPMQCLRDIPKPLFNVTVVDMATKRMREFMISNVVKRDDGKVFVGNEMVSELALIGLWKTREKNEDSERWLCRNASMTLGILPTEDEDEPALGMRLLRLHAGAFIDTAPPGYECPKSTVRKPHGYKPRCKHSVPETCKPQQHPK